MSSEWILTETATLISRRRSDRFRTAIDLPGARDGGSGLECLQTAEGRVELRGEFRGDNAVAERLRGGFVGHGRGALECEVIALERLGIRSARRAAACGASG